MSNENPRKGEMSPKNFSFSEKAEMFRDLLKAFAARNAYSDNFGSFDEFAQTAAQIPEYRSEYDELDRHAKKY